MTITSRVFNFSAIAAMLLFFQQIPSFGQHASLPNANKKIIIRYFDEVINARKLERISEFFSQNYIWHQMDGTDVHSSKDSAHVAMFFYWYVSSHTRA